MHFIAVHKFQKDSTTRNVFYLNPEHISMIEAAEDSSRVILCSGREILVTEPVDDLITKVRGFTKPARAAHPEHASSGERLTWE